MKCEKCGEAEATVFFSTISGKFRATRKRYCRTCMEGEKVRLVVQQPPEDPGNKSLMELVQGEMAKQDKLKAPAPEAGQAKPGDKSSKGLEKKMKDAIREERYEDAARIRDQLTSLTGKEPKAEDPKAGNANQKGPRPPQA